MYIYSHRYITKDENERTNVEKTNNYIFYETYRKNIIYEQNNVENKINKH